MKASVMMFTYYKKFFLFFFFFVFLFVPSIATASIPTWRILWTILPRLNVTHTDGVKYNFTLNQDEITKIREMAGRVERFIEAASNHAVNIEMTIVESTGIVRSLTENDDHLFVGEDDFPADIKSELNRADDEGRPYHLKVATFRLDGDSEKINNWHGLGGGTYARAHFLGMSYYIETETQPHPEEVWIHELLHCFEYLFNEYGTMAGLHDATDYGYEDINGWYKWYWDILAGKVKKPSTGEYVGIKADMWRHLPAGRIEYWKGHTYKLLDLVRNWNSAKEYCESLGGHLVTITSEGEQNAVATLLNRASTWNYFGYWMGGQKESNWRWITGEAFKYTNFSQNQPDGFGNYLEMYNYPAPGYWDDTTANANVEIQGGLYPRGIICEWEYVTKPSISILTANHLPGGVINANYAYTLTIDGASNLTYISGNLPSGLTFSTSGLLSGIPTETGSFDFTIKAENASTYDLKTFTLDITSDVIAPVITTVDLKDANVNNEYYQGLEISGSSATWEIIGEDLPSNLTLSQTGEITGKPLAEGNYKFTVRAKNSTGYNDKTFSIKVTNETFPVTEMVQDDEQNTNGNNLSANGSDGGNGCSTVKFGYFIYVFLMFFVKKNNFQKSTCEA